MKDFGRFWRGQENRTVRDKDSLRDRPEGRAGRNLKRTDLRQNRRFTFQRVLMSNVQKNPVRASDSTE